MLLGEIRDYVKKRGDASLKDISLHFDITQDSVQFAIAYWQRTGKIRERSAASCGSGACGGCSSNNTQQISYEWVSRNIPMQWDPSH